MRMVLPFTCSSRSAFLTPGTSARTTKSSPCQKTLSGGYAPRPLGPASSQPLVRKASKACCRPSSVSKGLGNSAIAHVLPSPEGRGTKRASTVPRSLRGEAGTLLPAVPIELGAAVAGSRGGAGPTCLLIAPYVEGK